MKPATPRKPEHHRWGPLTAALPLAPAVRLLCRHHSGQISGGLYSAPGAPLIHGATMVVLGVLCFTLPAVAPSWALAGHPPWLGSFALLQGSKPLFDARQVRGERVAAEPPWLNAMWLRSSFLPLMEFARRVGASAGPASPAWRRCHSATAWYGALALGLAVLSLGFGSPLLALRVGAHRSRRSRRFKHSIAISTSGAKQMPVHVERGLQAGFWDYLPKPLDLVRLMTLLGELATLPRR